MTRTMTKRLPLLLAAVCALALVAAGCGSSSNKTTANPPAASSPQSSSSSGSGGTVTVDMKNIAFSPNSVTVKVGQTVKWVNQDTVAHNVTAQSGAFKSTNFGPGASFTFKATKPGTFGYVCTIHPGMIGTLIVK
jgi:plastocyanin